MKWRWLLLMFLLTPTALAAQWQYAVPYEAAKLKPGQEARVYCWIPPQTKTLRGLLIGGQLGIELEIALDPQVRKVCAEEGIGIVYFVPHLSGVFHFWEEGNQDGQRLLTALEDLAKKTAHPEITRVPWITMGHSTAGIFCRNVAYWRPDRVAGVIHIKSGNFHQKEHLPTTGSLAGIPLLAINGQFETFGPAAGIQPELGRQTQWIYVRKDLEIFRTRAETHLMSMWIDLGGDHFHGSPELSSIASLFIAKTAKYRIGPDGCLPLKAESGWLSDSALNAPQHPAAPYAQYTGDKHTALWHYDKEMAEALTTHYAKMDHHQCLDNPKLSWLDEGDGWTFTATSAWLDTMPPAYGGAVSNQKVGHAATPIQYRCKINEPVEQIAPDRFRLLRPIKTINIAAMNTGDEQYRPTNRWGSLAVPQIKGTPQTIDFAEIGTIEPAEPMELKAQSSANLPIHFEVDYGPVEVRDGKLVVSELPINTTFPIECRVTAYQMGRRIAPLIAPATPVSRTFLIAKD